VRETGVRLQTSRSASNANGSGRPRLANVSMSIESVSESLVEEALAAEGSPARRPCWVVLSIGPRRRPYHPNRLAMAHRPRQSWSRRTAYVETAGGCETPEAIGARSRRSRAVIIPWQSGYRRRVPQTVRCCAVRCWLVRRRPFGLQARSHVLPRFKVTSRRLMRLQTVKLRWRCDRNSSDLVERAALRERFPTS